MNERFYERGQFAPAVDANAQLRERELPFAMSVVRLLKNSGVRITTIFPGSLEPMSRTGVAVKTNGETDGQLYFAAAVDSIFDNGTAPVFLSEDIDYDTGASLIQFLTSAGEIWQSKAASSIEAVRVGLGALILEE